MRKLLRFLVATAFLFFGTAFILSAQHSIMVTGTVTDSDDGSPLVGVVVMVRNSSVYSVTDTDGRYSINVPTNRNELEFSIIGFKPQNITVKSPTLDVSMVSDAEMLNESKVIAYGKQSMMSITGSITSIGTEDLLRSPNGSIGNALAGAVTGISSIQVSGQPGNEDPTIYVRGTGSLTESASSPLILVDGVERSFFQMDPNEIESVTVLKDAASTAVFGVRGANGVILVTTRRGSEGKMNISLSSSVGATQALRNLYTVNSYEYAQYYSEAQMGDNPNLSSSELAFTPFIVDRFRLGDEPIMFPDVDWNDYIFRKFSWQTQHNLTVSGGGKKINYFISLGYLHQDGVMKRYYEDYDPNYTYNRYNYRANFDINPTRTTTIHLNIGGRVGDTREPKTWALWQNIMWCLPFASPGFVDGKYISNADNKYIPLAGTTSALDLYYNYGYTRSVSNVLNLDISLDQSLDFITKGLSFNAKGAYNITYGISMDRTPQGTASTYKPVYLGTYTTPGLDVSDENFDRTIVYQTAGVPDLHQPMTYGEGSWASRNWYLEGSFNYARSFGSHDVTALLLYNQSKTYYPSAYRDIPAGYVGYVGRVTYAFRKRYMFDFNAGYNGSENFAPGLRYGFFPAGSAGWIVTEEKFMKNQHVLDFLKLRVSYGLVGNDKYSGERFLYLPDSWNGKHSASEKGGTYQFGTGYSDNFMYDAQANTLGNHSVSWEKCAKQNYGFDLKMLNYRLSLTADLFYEHRWDILSTRNTFPGIADIELPLINLGIVDNHGYEISLGWDEKVHQVRHSFLFNMSYSKNKIIYMDEVNPVEPYMAQTGRSTGLNYGYLFDRFLTPEDFDSNGELIYGSFNEDGVYEGIPHMALGTPRPGDALFKDLNGDGEANAYDCTYFGYGNRPEYVFGFLTNIEWRGWGISMQWTGATHADRLLTGEYREAFGTDNSRALLRFLADGRSCEENGYQGRFPRLTFMNKNHYSTTSDLWMMDGSYLRLKTAEISYTFNSTALKKAGIQSAKVYASGYNILTLFSELNDIDIDPEGFTGGDPSSTYNYPNNRIYNLGINLAF